MNKNFPPHGLPSDFLHGFGFDADPTRPSFIKTVVDGAVFSRASRIRPSDTATLVDRANSLSDIISLGPKTSPSQTSKTWIGTLGRLFARALVEIYQLFRLVGDDAQLRLIRKRNSGDFREFPESRGGRIQMGFCDFRARIGISRSTSFAWQVVLFQKARSPVFEKG